MIRVFVIIALVVTFWMGHLLFIWWSEKVQQKKRWWSIPIWEYSSDVKWYYSLHWIFATIAIYLAFYLPMTILTTTVIGLLLVLSCRFLLRYAQIARIEYRERELHKTLS